MARLKAVVALEEEVGGLHHEGKTSLTDDGAKGLLHKALEEGVKPRRLSLV